MIRAGRKSKEKIDVFSFELLAYRELVNQRAMPGATSAAEALPEIFHHHRRCHAAPARRHPGGLAEVDRFLDLEDGQRADRFPYEQFKGIYLYAHEQGLKGCTTFRFNPEVHQGVLVKGEDLHNTFYVFTLEDGSEVEVRGDEQVEYDGEMHSAANLFDALKEGYYGKF